MLEQVFSGLFLAIRAVVESVRSLKTPRNDLTAILSVLEFAHQLSVFRPVECVDTYSL